MSKIQKPNDLGEQCMNVLRKAYDHSVTINQRVIHPDWLAAKAYERMDKGKRAPTLVRYAALLSLRKMAGVLCAGEEKKQEAAAELQKRYLVNRLGEQVYVLREEMTLEERHWKIANLRAESEAKAKHADALQAETDTLVMQGYFERETTGRERSIT